MLQQRALAGRADAGNFLQAGLADVALAPRAVRADREAVRLVAQPLRRNRARGSRGLSMNGSRARHEEGLAPGVAVRPLGDATSGTSVMPSAASVSCAARELAAAAVDQHEIGPGRIASSSSQSPRRRSAIGASRRVGAPAGRNLSLRSPRLSAAVSSTAGVGSSARRLVDQPLEAAAQAPRASCRSRRPGVRSAERMLNLRYWFFRKPSGPATIMAPTAFVPWMWLLS